MKESPILPPAPELSVVVPVLDEEEAIAPFLDALRPVLDAAV